MKRAATMCVAAFFGCAVAVTAQAQQTGQEPPSDTQRRGTATSDQTGQGQTTTASQAGRAGTSMFIGCVEKGSTPNAFVLNVLEIPGSTAGAVQPQAHGQARGQGQGQTQVRAGQTTGTTGTSMVGHRVELVGGTNLAAHLGHKVEISGMVAPQGNATGRAGQTPAADMRVNVSNVRMIDAKCEAAAATRGTAGTSGTSTAEPMPAPGTQKTQPDPQPAPGGRQY